MLAAVLIGMLLLLVSAPLLAGQQCSSRPAAADACAPAPDADSNDLTIVFLVQRRSCRRSWPYKKTRSW
jgi:hypothetical protein